MAKGITDVMINKERCKGCELCVNACPQGVLEMSKDINTKGYFYAHAVKLEDCTGCLSCALMCPDVAITITQKKAS